MAMVVMAAGQRPAGAGAPRRGAALGAAWPQRDVWRMAPGAASAGAGAAPTRSRPRARARPARRAAPARGLGPGRGRG